MISLILAELNRLRSRRLVLVALVVVVLGLGAFQLAVNSAVSPPSAAEVAAGKVQYEQGLKDYEQNKADYELSEKECRASSSNPDQECDLSPKLEWYVPSATAFAEIASAGAMMAVLLSGLALFLTGASFIGAEYTSGSISNWLTFIPQRWKVFTSKIVALALGAAVTATLALGLTVGVAALLTRIHGGNLVGLSKTIQASGRGIVLVVVIAVIGFALALVARHTAAAIGAVLGYLLITVVLQFLYNPLPSLQKIKAWLPENNLLAFLNHGYTYADITQTVTPEGLQYDNLERHITFGHSAVYWAVVVVVAVAGSLLVFRRRDVN